MFHPRYNIVPPGVDQDHFFPYWEKKRRDEALGQELTRYVFHGGDDATSRFRLADTDKKPIYSIARLDKIKNITGLAEAFGKSEALRKHCNLIVVAGPRGPGRFHGPRGAGPDRSDERDRGKIRPSGEHALARDGDGQEQGGRALPPHGGPGRRLRPTPPCSRPSGSPCSRG